MAGPLGRPTLAAPRFLKSTYLADGETLLRETRATRLYYLPMPILATLLALGLLYGDAADRFGWPGIPGLTAAFAFVNGVGATLAEYLLDVLLVVTLAALLWFVVRYLRWISTVYAVTTQRVLIQRGIVARDFDEIPLLQIRGVDVHQTALQRMAKFGTMYVSSEGGVRSELGNESWAGIPRPFEFQRIVESASQNLATGRTAPIR